MWLLLLLLIPAAWLALRKGEPADANGNASDSTQAAPASRDTSAAKRADTTSRPDSTKPPA